MGWVRVRYGVRRRVGVEIEDGGVRHHQISLKRSLAANLCGHLGLGLLLGLGLGLGLEIVRSLGPAFSST